MKWTNKGHEFDRIGKEIKNNLKNKNKYYIYGAGIIGAEMFRVLKGLECYAGFIDANTIKQKQGYLGAKVISPQDFFRTEKEDSVVIVCASHHNIKVIMKKLILEGFKEGINCFTYERFNEFYLPLVYAYKFKKSYVKAVTVLITEKCTLKCINCGPLLPYAADSKHYEVEELRKNTDLFFSKIDFVGEWVLTGGEPLMHPQICDIVEYVGENYLNQIGSIVLITNGTIIPKENLIKLFKKYDVNIVISDYSETIPDLEGTLNKIDDIMIKNELRFTRYKTETWLDYGFNSSIEKSTEKDEMINYFDSCYTPCRGYIDEKLYFCTPSRMAEKVLNKQEDSINALDLNEYDKKNKQIIIEFDMGFCENGYLDMCTTCNGYFNINRNVVPVARQIVNKSRVEG